MISPHGPQTATTRTGVEQSSSLIPDNIILILVGIIIPGALCIAFSEYNEWQVVAVVLGLLGAVLIMARPHWGLAFFTALLYTRPEESMPELAGMRLTLIVSVIMLVAMWVNIFMSKQDFARTPTIGLMVGFALVVVLAAVSHGNTTDTLEVVMKLGTLVFLILNLIRTPAKYQAYIDVIILLSTYLSAYSIYLFLSGQVVFDKIHEVNRSLGTGIFSDPNDLAITVVAGFALTLVRIIQLRGAAKIFPVLACGIMIWAVFLSASRGGLLSMLVVIVGFFLTFSRYKALGMTVAVLFGLAVIIIMPSRMTDFDSTEESANDRFAFWQNGISQFVHSPIRGIGYNGYKDINGGRAAHNSFVCCFVENGYIGYFCWMGMIFYAFRRRTEAGVLSLKAADEDPVQNRIAREQLIGARLALCGFLAAAFWLSRTYVPVLYIFLCLPVIVQLVHSSDSNTFGLGSKERWSDFVRINALCISSIILIWVMAHKLH
jgi:putative inorganic carbon (HCO3(-)) transporter